MKIKPVGRQHATKDTCLCVWQPHLFGFDRRPALPPNGSPGLALHRAKTAPVGGRLDACRPQAMRLKHSSPGGSWLQKYRTPDLQQENSTRKTKKKKRKRVETEEEDEVEK